jgi:hypothetical protein
MEDTMTPRKTDDEAKAYRHLKDNARTIRVLRRAIEALELDTALAEAGGVANIRELWQAPLTEFRNEMDRLDRLIPVVARYAKAINTVETATRQRPFLPNQNLGL